MIIATLLFYVLILYFLLGLVYVVWYMRARMAKRDEDTLHTSRSIKAVFIPGLILTWPVTLLKWQKPIESYSNSVQILLDRHLILWLLLAIILPVITLLSVLNVPKEFPEKPIRTTALILNHQNGAKESPDYIFQLRKTSPDSIQLEIVLKHIQDYPADLLILDSKEQWLTMGKITARDTQWFSLPSGLMPGQIHFGILDRNTNQLIQQIKL